MKAVMVAVVVAGVLGASPIAAQEPEARDVADTEFTPDEFLAIFDEAILDGLAPIEADPPAILGSAEVDARIRTIGEGRGYQRRANPDRDLVVTDGVPLQPEAADAWESLQAAAAEAGHTLSVYSGYRSVATQIFLFKRRLSGTSDAAIDRRLRTIAVPGYSKHHTGYAIDIRSSTGRGFAFGRTAAYRWLADDNFANAKRHGWVPSYPEGTGPAGPIPEPWEFVWVGTQNILCADFEPSDERPLCDTDGHAFETDIAWLFDTGITEGCRVGRFCGDAAVTRGEIVTMLWRQQGRPPPGSSPHPFVDVSPDNVFAPAVSWAFASGVTGGTTPTTFEPDRELTRAEFVTFLWRLAGGPAPTASSVRFGDVASSSFAADAIEWAAEIGVTRGTSATTFDPGRRATRAEAAAFIRRFVNR
ncbi:MAG: M15 family metallopeptidase [Actinomycetota bacterium]